MNRPRAYTYRASDPGRLECAGCRIPFRPNHRGADMCEQCTRLGRAGEYFALAKMLYTENAEQRKSWK
jgi:hypothetical protein